MHLAKQGVCVCPPSTFFSPIPPASLREDSEQGGFGCRPGVECGLEVSRLARETSLLSALSEFWKRFSRRCVPPLKRNRGGR